MTVFDSAPVPGGLLVNGVPAFKLDRSIVQRRIELLKQRGVVFRLGTELRAGAKPGRPEINNEDGKGRSSERISLEQLRKEFNAVFLGLDSRKARALDVPGADLRGVIQAVPFLLQKNTPIQMDLPRVEVAGKRVVVLGGGDTAMDCLRAAVRYGAREAVGVYRRDQADMPCSRREYKNAVEEGARFVFCAAPVAVLGNSQRQVTGLRLIRTELGLTDAEGPRPFLLQPGTEFELEADWVITALGFDPLPCPDTGEFDGFALNDWGGLMVDAGQMTTLPGVFAGGDLVRSPSSVLNAVRDARRAAAQIHAYLSVGRPAAAV